LGTGGNKIIMKIGIVISYISQKPAGLERYSYELVKGLINQDATNSYYIYTKKGNKLDTFSFLKNNTRVNIVEVGWGKLWKDLGLFLAPRSDIYLFTGSQGPLFFRPLKSITIVYDFAYKHLGKSVLSRIRAFFIDLWSKRAFAIANKIVCISQETRKDLMKLFDIEKSKPFVIYPGFNNICNLPEKEIKIPTNKFFLFVGTIKERKNVLNIIKGFDEFLKLNQDGESYHLLLCGKNSHSDEYYKSLVEVISNRGISKNVHFFGHVTDGELSYIYKRATALVYPSFIEGFGLPILEAMSCSLPVITSNISSLREIAQGRASLVDPNDFINIGQEMNKIVNDNQYRMDLISKGSEYAIEFSWTKMAKEFAQLIEKVSNE